MAEKAQKGDLVRITADWAMDYKGKIVEVDAAFEGGDVNVINDGSYLWLESEDYVIHRKAGEEDTEPKSRRLQKSCRQCGEYLNESHTFARSGYYFCGNYCADLFDGVNAGEEDEKPKLHCDYCGKQIRGVYSRCTTGNYCGDACAEEGSNAVIAEKIAKRGAEETQADRIRKAGKELTDLLVHKNHDYGDSFAKQYEKYGLMSALIRMDDKMRRLETLLGGTDAQVDESIRDSLLDLAGYALLASIEAGKR